MFIAIYSFDGSLKYVGTGVTLESAFHEVEHNYSNETGDTIEDRNDVKFFEATMIEVEFKIVRKEVVSKVTTKK